MSPNSPTSTNSTNSNDKLLSGVDVSKVDLSTVKWDGPPKQSLKKSQIKSQRRVEYKVDDIGVVAEEWRIQVASTGEQPTNTELAQHSVYINGQLVRQVDLKAKKVTLSESKYEPFNFLRYGTTGSTEQEQQKALTEKVALIDEQANKEDPAQDKSEDKAISK